MAKVAGSANVLYRAAMLADDVAYRGGTPTGAAAFDVAGYRVTVARAACRVEDCACNCRWGQHGGRACSHVRAVRLAWRRAAAAYAARRAAVAGGAA